MNRAQAIVAILICLWLPLQGYSAVAMPLCEHGRSGKGALQTKVDDAGHMRGQPAYSAQSHSEHEHGDHDSGFIASGNHGESLVCDDCSFCTLSCASTLPCSGFDRDPDAVHNVHVSNETFLTGVILPRPGKPPLLG